MDAVSFAWLLSISGHNESFAANDRLSGGRSQAGFHWGSHLRKVSTLLCLRTNSQRAERLISKQTTSSCLLEFQQNGKVLQWIQNSSLSLRVWQFHKEKRPGLIWFCSRVSIYSWIKEPICNSFKVRTRQISALDPELINSSKRRRYVHSPTLLLIACVAFLISHAPQGTVG